MKKIYTVKKGVVFSRNVDKRRFLRKQLSKKKKKAKLRKQHKFFCTEKARQQELRRLQRQADRFTNKDYVKAPARLSFIDNTEEVVGFLRQIDSRYNKRLGTFVDLSQVEEVTHDALVLLLSICLKFRADGVAIDGCFSKASNEVNKIIDGSGFFDELYRNLRAADGYALTRKLIQLRANTQVRADQSSKLITEATRTIWGEPRRCQGVQAAFIELMHNTNNHASPKNPGSTQCWISTKHYPGENKVSFALLDFGIGIFESLKNKPEGNPFYKITDRLMATFSSKDNAEVLRLILNGELHKTVTGKYYRGKGLPSLKQMSDRKQVSNLVIITNNVRADVQNNKYEIMKNSFSGTFVYWDLSRANKSSPYIYTN